MTSSAPKKRRRKRMRTDQPAEPLWQCSFSVAHQNLQARIWRPSGWARPAVALPSSSSSAAASSRWTPGWPWRCGWWTPGTLRFRLCWSPEAEQQQEIVKLRWIVGTLPINYRPGRMAHLEGIPPALLLQQSGFIHLPDEPLGIVNGVYRVFFRLFGCFMSNQHRRGREWDTAGDTQPALLVCDHLHIPATGVEDSHGAEGGAQVQSDDLRFGRRKVLLAQVPGQEQGQDRRTCSKRTSLWGPADGTVLRIFNPKEVTVFDLPKIVIAPVIVTQSFQVTGL